VSWQKTLADEEDTPRGIAAAKRTFATLLPDLNESNKETNS
jgi:hypothetical protein